MPAFKSARAHAGHLVSNYAIILGAKLLPGMGFLHDTNTCEYTVPCSGNIWAVPKGVAQSIAIGYCIQHGGGSNCPATETWDVANLFLQSREFPSLTHPLETLFGAGIKKETCWWLYHQGSVSLGVGNFRLHLSQRIRVWFSGWMSNLEEWNPDILGQLVCMQSNSRWFRVIDCHWPFTHLRDHTLQ